MLPVTVSRQTNLAHVRGGGDRPIRPDETVVTATVDGAGAVDPILRRSRYASLLRKVTEDSQLDIPAIRNWEGPEIVLVSIRHLVVTQRLLAVILDTEDQEHALFPSRQPDLIDIARKRFSQ